MIDNRDTQKRLTDKEKYRAQVSKAMIHIARKLRKSQTNAEDILWTALRSRRLNNLKFRRQHPVANTTYVVDFFCYKLNLIIEVDGRIHDTQQEEDTLRQSILEAAGYQVLRFSNEQVLNDTESVLVDIIRVANDISS